MSSMVRGKSPRWCSIVLNVWVVISLMGNSLMPAIAYAAQTQRVPQPLPPIEEKLFDSSPHLPVIIKQAHTPISNPGEASQPTQTLPQIQTISGTTTLSSSQSILYLPLIVDGTAEQEEPHYILITEAGGELVSPDGQFTITVPANAVNEPVYLQYRQEESLAAASSETTIESTFILEARRVVDDSPVNTLNVPLHITAQLTTPVSRTLAIWQAGDWQPLPTTVDRATQTASASTSSLSSIAVMTNISAAAATVLAPPLPEVPSTGLPNPFFVNTITYLHNLTETVWLSSTADGSGPLWTDDQVTITFMPSGGIYTVNHSALGPGITQTPPEDITPYLIPGNNTISIELVDLIPPVNSTGGYQLVTTSGVSDTIPPTIYNVTRWMNGQGNVIIRAQVFDASGVGPMTLLFNGTSVTMIPVGGGFYQATVPSEIGQINELQITATDLAGNVGFFPNPSASAEFLGYQSRRLGWGVCKDTGCPPGQCGCGADPVNTSNGNFTDRVTDLVVPGIGDTALSIERGYNSLPNEPLGVIRYEATASGVEEEAINVHPEPFGPGWTFPLATSLIVLTYTTPITVQVRYPDGHTAEFEDSGGGTFSPFEPRVYDELSGNAGGYVLTRKNRTEYHFDGDGDLTQIIDRNGNTATLTYDGDKRLIRAENSAGHWLEFEYNDTDPALITDIHASLGRHLHYEYKDGYLIEAIDPNGNPTTYEYQDGRLSNVTLPDNKPALEMIYDPTLGRVTEQTMGDTATYTFAYTGLTTTMTDILNQTTTHVYDADFLLIESRDNAGHSEFFNYNADEQRTFFQDRNGNQWVYDYDNQGNLLERRDPVVSCAGSPATEDVTRWAYDGYSQVISMTNALDHTWLYNYDATGNLTHITAPDTAETELDYDGRGLLIKVTDALSRETRYAYDSFGNLTQTTDATGHLSLSTYDLAGREVAYTDANDHTVYFEYDGNSNLTRIADAKQQVTAFTYDANDLLVSSRDRRGVVSDFEYNDYLQLIAERDFPDGQWQQYAYDALYRQESVTDRLGYITEYGYDEVNRLETVTDPLGEVTRYGYDPNGNVTRIVDELEARTDLAYDAANRVERVTDPAGYTTTYCYDVEDRLVQVTGPRGGITRYEYDELDRLIKMTDPLEAITRYEYDAEGNRTAVIDGAGRRTDYEYDALNRLVSIAQPELSGGVRPTTRFEYDPVGNLTAITSPRGYPTRFTYDANDNLATMTDPLGGQVSYSYDAEDNPLTVTDPNQHTTTTAYNQVGLPVRITNPLSHTTRLAYDAAYNLVEIVDALDHPTRYEYDPRQQLIREIDPLNQTTVYQRDARGQVTAVADANGHITRYSYDVRGQLIAVTDARGGLTQYEYDPVGNLVGLIDANDHPTRFAYNLRNELVKEVNPLQNTWQYGYDAVGNLVRRVDAKEQVTHYHYDSNDRLIEVEYPDAAALFAYDLDGNETQMCDWLSTVGGGEGDCTQHSYDPLGRLTETTDWLGRTVGREYDPASNLTGLTYPNGYQVGYAYDAADRLTEMIDPHDGRSRYQYNPLGQVTGLAHPNDTVATFSYDQANRLTALDNRRTLAAQPQSAYAYALDKVGNRVQVTETRAAFDGSGPPVTLTRDYTYDALNRLTDVATETTPGTSQSPDSDTGYSFDAVGNRLAKNGTVLAPDPGTPDLPVAPRPEAVSSTYNATNQLTAVSDQQSATTLEYDRNGNRTREVETRQNGQTITTEYGYDRENRLVDVTKRRNNSVIMTAVYTYDGYGRRVRKEVNNLQSPISSLQMTYLYDGLEIIGVTLEQGGTTKESYFYLAPSPLTGLRRPLAMEQLNNGKRYWYQSDGLDSIVALTDSAGRLVSPFLYDEYGQILAGETDLQMFTYTAQDYDPETGLYHFYARYYDPARGVWLSQDRYRGIEQNPLTLHRYGYVANNPTNRIDWYGYYWGEDQVNWLTNKANEGVTKASSWVNNKWNNLKESSNPAARVAVGFGEGAIDAAKGLYDVAKTAVEVTAAVQRSTSLLYAVTNPKGFVDQWKSNIQFARNLGNSVVNLARNPQQIVCIANNLKDGLIQTKNNLIQAWNDDPYKFAGRATFEIVSTFGPAAVSKAGKAKVITRLVAGPGDDLGKAVTKVKKYRLARSHNYRESFEKTLKSPLGSRQVDHRIPIHIADKYPKATRDALDILGTNDINDVRLLQAIDPSINRSELNRLWNDFARNNPNPSGEDILIYMYQVDEIFAGQKINNAFALNK